MMNRVRVGRNIKNRRKKLKMTQAELAQKANISVIHVSHIENGNVNMSLETLMDICEALKITPDEILNGEYLTISIPDAIFRNRSDKITPQDRLLLQKIYRFLAEQRMNQEFD